MSSNLIELMEVKSGSTVVVYDVHASESGALSILNDFYEQVCNYEDKSIQWIFVVSIPEYQETGNIKVFRYPWVKKSWLHRLYFDFFIGANLIRKYKPDRICSLQNKGVPFFKGKQYVYLHLPFILCEYSFRLGVDEKKLWFYQKILSKIIFRSLKKVEKVIVQTNWMKEALISKCKIGPEKVIVQAPKFSADMLHVFVEKKDNYHRFFYPATAFRYKNHLTLLKAVEYAVGKGLRDYEVFFTVKQQENDYTKELWEFVEKNHLNVKFLGQISREMVFKMYSESVLLFPSTLESFGMPLLEARLTGCPVIAGDCPFSHEILDGYAKAEFFSVMDWREMGEKLFLAANEKQ